MEPSHTESSGSLITYRRAGNFSLSAAPLESVESFEQFDFIDLLAVAQRFDVDFLPITWQPALECIGEGATAEIRQSLIDLQMSFAFKQFKNQKSNILKAIISEIMVLRYSSLRKHRNIVTLQGICWDFTPTGEAWPVLVFEKAKMGDLRKFMESEIGQNLSLARKLNICSGIAAAVHEMHLHGVIHGDLKPQNILVFEESSGEYVAGVTDFGYSTIFAGSALIDMPFSEMFTAPEWHHRGFVASDAMRMDAYSFGVLCLWIITVENTGADSLLDSLSTGINLLVLAHRLVDSSTGANQQERVILHKLFDLTLQEDTKSRCGDLVQILQLFEPGIMIDTSTTDEPLHATSMREDFQNLPTQLSASAAQLYRADYRLRNHITSCLHQKLNSTNSKLSDAKTGYVAFELSICYSLGFGTYKDDYESQIYLDRSLKVSKDLQCELDSLRQKPTWSFRERMIGDLFAKGMVSTIEFAHSYREQGLLDLAYENYRREIKDTQDVLGDKHEIVGMLKSIFSKILRDQGDYAEAEALQQQVVEAEKDISESRRPVLLVSMGNLSSIYMRQGLWKKAETMCFQVMEMMKQAQGETHATTLACRSNLAAIYIHQCRWEEAKNLLLEIVANNRAIRGESHPSTLMGMSNLAMCFAHLNLPEEAEELQMQTMTTREKVLGPDHPDTLISMNNVGMILYEKRDWSKAEKLYSEILKRQQKLGPNHPSLLTTMGNLASTYLHQQRLDKCVQLNSEVLEIRKKSLGMGHPDTLTSMAHLAYVYSITRNLEETTALQEQVVEGRRKALGDSNPDTLAGMQQLVATYGHRGMWKEAEELQVQLVAIKRQMSTIEDENTLACMNHLGVIWYKQGRHQEAIPLALEVTEKSKKLFGERHPKTRTSMANVATMYKAIGDTRKARALQQEVLDIQRDCLLGEQHPEIVKSLNFLASLDIAESTS